MPILYVIQKGYNLVNPTPVEDIVYCVSTVQQIMANSLEFIFTDGHAVDAFSAQYEKGDIGNIDTLLDMKAIRAKFWKDENDLDLKRRKEAEFLVLGDVPVTAILGYLVYNEPAKQKLLDIGVKETRIHIKPQFYF